MMIAKVVILLAVGCYQNKDYYKCKYCRYVAPFTSNVTQNYQYSEYSTLLHKIINSVIGLNYTMYESHTYDQTHTWVNNTQHRSSCICGEESLQGHAVTSDAFNSGAQTAICLLCGGSASVGFIQNNNKVKISDNGSYILSNGLVVLENVDVEAYLNDTLVFREISEEIK